jgi:hypothetical protein
MATSSYFDNSELFTNAPQEVPFGTYGIETSFQNDCNNATLWCARRLGYPMVDIELQTMQFWACFEEATLEYTAQVNRFNIRENLLLAKGASTGSNLSHRNLTPNLGRQIAISKQYGTEAGVGGDVPLYSASLSITAGQQTYNLTDSDIVTFESGTPNNDVFEVRRVFYESSPAMTRFFDPHIGSGLGSQQMLSTMGWGSYSPAINYLMMPLYDDLLRVQAIEFNDLVRKSAYSFELVNNQLTIFPQPEGASTLWFHYLKTEDRNNLLIESVGTVSDYSNINYSNTLYADINDPGKQWIRKYTLALCKELLGTVRGKYPSIPTPGGETSLDGDTLRSEGAAERDVLIEQLREDLEQSSRRNMMERNSEEAQFQQDTINKIPLNIYIG